MFLFFPLVFYAQSVNTPYNLLWKKIKNDSISKDQIISYLSIYIQKAQIEKNLLEEYKAIDLKTEYLINSEAIVLSDRAIEIAKTLKNDSLIENSLLTKASYLFLNRNFKESLDYTLQAETYNLKTKSIYSLNSIRLDIGYIYYYTKDYEKAKRYILKAANYYKTKDEPAHIQSYVVSLYNLSKTYWQLNNTDSLQITILEAYKTIPNLENIDQLKENPYIDYVNGGLHFLQENYSEAQKYFFKALPHIKDQNDFTNEHIIYLYLGKIYWNQNQKEKAITYFKQIDSLFSHKKFLNYELREAYNYLIEYYRNTNQPEKQLQATESLIALNHQFEKEQQYLTNTLHYDLETKKLEESKFLLQEQIKKSETKFILFILASIVICLLLVIYAVLKHRERKKLRLQFETLINQNALNVFQVKYKLNNKSIIESLNNSTETTLPLNLSSTEQKLLNKLEAFEQEKRYLLPIKLEDLAREFETNRNTLSQIINKHKGVAFTNYINKLRIQQLILDLKDNKDLRKLNMQGLAETYGFASARTFTNQFKAETNLTPAYFIEQLDL